MEDLYFNSVNLDMILVCWVFEIFLNVGIVKLVQYNYGIKIKVNDEKVVVFFIECMY